MKAFKDNNDGYYEFPDTAPDNWHAHLTPCPIQTPLQPTSEQLAAIAQAEADLIEKQNAKTDLVTQYLITHTIAEINAYIDTNVDVNLITNLATAKTVITDLRNIVKKLAAVVSVIAKEELR